MTEYQRFFLPNATPFFTVNLAERNNNPLLVEKIDSLRQAFGYVKLRKPFQMLAVVVLPDHLHCIWVLPAEDSNYPVRWSMLKGYFSRSIEKNERISTRQLKRRERGIWQRRFWAHLILDQEDYNSHIDYIHWNPVKHGYVKHAGEWEYSSFNQFVASGIYPRDWGFSGQFDLEAGE